MAQIILIESNQSMSDILSLNLKTYLGATVITKNNVEEALELITLLPEVDLIICKHRMGTQASGEMVQHFLVENNRETSLIILGYADFDLSPHTVNVKDQFEWEEVLKVSAKLLHIDQEALNKKVRPDFVPIPIGHFYNIRSSACDVFIRIKKSADDFQFIKRIHGGDGFSPSVIRKYHEQGLQNLYIAGEDLIPFTNHVSDQLVEKLEQGGVDLDTNLIVLAESYQVALHDIRKLGFNSATLQLTDAIVNKMSQLQLDQPDLSVLLKKVINSQSPYLYQHAHLTSLISGEILKIMNLNQKPSQLLMAHGSLFKDITLADSPRSDVLAKISSFSELEDIDLSDEEWDQVFNHAKDAALLILKNPEAPKGLDQVLKTHHGAQNGKGFSHSQVNELTTLEQIFIVSCEFARELLRYKEEGGKPRPLIKELYEKFQGDEIKSIIQSLEKVLKGLKK